MNEPGFFTGGGGPQCYRNTVLSCVSCRTLATDTCSCGLVQVFPFSRCVVRVLALGIHTARFTRFGSLFARVCASGPLGDWETARRNSPADLKHTQPPSRKQDIPDETRKTVMHFTLQGSQHSTAPRLALVCVTCLCVSSSVVRPCHVTRGIIHSFMCRTHARAERASTVRHETQHARCNAVFLKTWSTQTVLLFFLRFRRRRPTHVDGCFRVRGLRLSLWRDVTFFGSLFYAPFPAPLAQCSTSTQGARWRS